MAHSWEKYEQSWRGRDLHVAAAREDDDSSDEEPDFHNFTGEDAAHFFIELIMMQVWAGKMSAKTACLLCFWASKAGASDPIGKYGFPPGKQSGHYMRHLDSASGTKLAKARLSCYSVNVPQHCKYDYSRTVHPMLIRLPHECLHDEFVEDHASIESLRGQIATKSLPPIYFEHDIVKRHAGKPVMPCALYLDGVPFSNRDGLLGVFVYSLISQVRHLVAIIRKSNICRCGCRGWCTIQPVFDVIKWSFVALANATFPLEDHTGSGWAANDSRREKQGTPLVMPFCLLQIRGDWMEFAHTLGFMSWRTVLYPCMYCLATQDEQFDDGEISHNTFVHSLLTQSDIDASIQACEIKVQLTADLHNRLCALLYYDSKKDGGRGRCIPCDMPDANLFTGDRLEPDGVLRDVAAFEQLCEPWPIVTFWRRGLETRVRHRFPLLSNEIGVSIDHICIDKLHTLYLGICQDFCACVAWACFDADVWGVRAEGRTQDEADEINVCRIRSRLFAYYRHHRMQGGSSITEAENFTLGMLGSRSLPACKLKGLETKGAVPFFLSLAKQHSGAIGATSRHLVRAGICLVTFFEIVDRNGTNVVDADYMQLCRVAREYVRVAQLADIRMKPKAHQFLHLVQRCGYIGNPNFYATMWDEGMNAVLAGVARSAHRSVWEARIFESFTALVRAQRRRS